MSGYKKKQNNMTTVHEGWLTKSPPAKRVWRAKWRRRWFTLRVSPGSPPHYFLDYYTDRNTRKQKGTIDLNTCEQVDAGLKMPRGNGDSEGLRGSVFSIQTQARTYHLEADSITEMEKWVENICRACGMKETTSESVKPPRIEEHNARNQPSRQSPVSSNSSEPYINMFDCVTGPPATNLESLREQRMFLTNAQNELAKAMALSEAAIATRNKGQPGNMSSLRKFIRVNDYPTYINNGEALLQERRNAGSYDANNPNSQLNALSRRFIRLSIGDNSVNPSSPIPPRPPKPLRFSIDAMHKESFVGPRIREPTEAAPHELEQSPLKHTTAHNMAIYANGAVGQQHGQRRNTVVHQGPSSGYCNINTPPQINRELKPGRSRTRTMRIVMESMPRVHVPPALQYLDLDLDTPRNSSTSKSQSHSPTNYNKVDFLKTNALNKTRLDKDEADKRRHENSNRD